MSTILDALKKSEQERKLSNVPTLSDMPAPQEPSRWPIVLTTLLVLVLLLGVVFGAYRVFSGNAPDLARDNVLPITNESVAQESTDNLNNQIVVNVVSYAQEADQRFVMINGKLYREGEFVRAGLRVAEITHDAVVLNQRGRRLVRRP